VATGVVITGIGPCIPFTSDTAELWTHVWSAEARNRGGRCAGLIGDHAVHAPAPHLRQMDRLGRLALTAAECAIADADLDISEMDAERIGIALGSAYGCLSTNADYLGGIRDRGPRRGNPIVFQNTVSNAATGYISIARGIRGANATMCSGWIAGLEALDFGSYQINEGRADVMIVGGVDQLFPALVHGLDARGFISPTGAPRPYDLHRDGMVMSDGSCFLVLEAMDHARARGRRMYAELAGLGQRSTANGNAAGALTDAVRLALRDAGSSLDDVDLVVSGANGTPADRCEGQALAGSLGDRAGEIPILFPKAAIGETMATAGPLAVALAAMALQKDVLPAASAPTHHDPECRVRIRDCAERAGPDLALVPLIADDGNAAAAVLRRIA
jgi:3-oxoacyl-(acyl-carrier-protein) synthase